MMTIHTRQIQLTKIHIRKTTSRGESTVYYGMHDNFLCDAKFSQFETYICPCERYESEWGSGYVPQFIFTFTPRWKWVVGFRPDRFGSEKRDMATAEQKPEWVSQSFRTFCRRQKIVTTAGSRTWSLAFVVSVVCGFCSFSHVGKLFQYYWHREGLFLLSRTRENQYFWISVKCVWIISVVTSSEYVYRRPYFM